MSTHLRVAPTSPHVDVPLQRSAEPVPMSVATTHVLLVSPDRLSRLGWSSSIRARLSGPLRIDEAPSAAAAMSVVATAGAPRLLLLDLRADDPGADALLAMLATVPSVRIVAIGGTDRVDRIQHVLKSGAGGFLFAGGTSPGDIAADAAFALGLDPGRSRSAGGRYPHSSDNVDVVNSTGIVCRLSRREVEILEHVAEGEPNAAIAHALGLSAFTVKSHLSRIGRRLGTGERGHMVYLALRAGAIS